MVGLEALPMASNAATVEEYLAILPENRRDALGTVRQTILGHLPPGYEEGMQYGLICYYVPHSRFPAGHRLDPKSPLPYVYLGSRAKHMSLYLLRIYSSGPAREWLEQAYTASGKKIDMGIECLAFKRLEDLPLDVIGQAIARTPVDAYIAAHLEFLSGLRSRRR